MTFNPSKFRGCAPRGIQGQRGGFVHLKLKAFELEMLVYT